MATMFGLTVFDGKLHHLAKLKIVCVRKSIALWDLHFLLCAFAAALLETKRWIAWLFSLHGIY